MLAGGVALYATNEFLTVSLLPSAIAEIGGARLYAWVTTLYLVGSVVLIIGFFAGSRGPTRLKGASGESAGYGYLGSRVVRWAPRDEQNRRLSIGDPLQRPWIRLLDGQVVEHRREHAVGRGANLDGRLTRARPVDEVAACALWARASQVVPS